MVHFFLLIMSAFTILLSGLKLFMSITHHCFAIQFVMFFISICPDDDPVKSIGCQQVKKGFYLNKELLGKLDIIVNGYIF